MNEPSGLTEQQKHQAIAEALDKLLNGAARGKARRNGFVVLTFPFAAVTEANYVSNAKRSDIITALREAADRLERNDDKEIKR